MNSISLSSNHARGMTLVEVMVAMAVLAIAGVAIVQSASGHLRAMHLVEQNSHALWVADNQMATLILKQSWKQSASGQGSEEIAQRTLFWNWQKLATPDPEFLSLRVYVYASEDSQRKRQNPITQLQTYVWVGS